MSKILSAPKHIIIEKTALALAAAWYEIGRSQGLTSKYKNAKLYASHNLEKFIPKSVEYLLDMLSRNDVAPSMKDEIYSALMERHNDPTLCKVMPNIDVQKAIEFAKIAEQKKPIDIIVEKAVQALKDKTLGSKDLANSTSLTDIDIDLKNSLQKGNSNGKESKDKQTPGS